MQLQKKWEIFAQQIDDFGTQANAILVKEGSVKTEFELEQVKIEIKEWNTNCYSYLKDSFDEENNEFAIDFYNAKVGRFIIGNRTKDFGHVKKEVFEDLKEKLITLIYFKKIVSISDAIIKDMKNFTFTYDNYINTALFVCKDVVRAAIKFNGT